MTASLCGMSTPRSTATRLVLCGKEGAYRLGPLVLCGECALEMVKVGACRAGDLEELPVVEA